MKMLNKDPGSRAPWIVTVASLLLLAGCGSSSSTATTTSSSATTASVSQAGSRTLVLASPSVGSIALTLPDAWPQTSLTFSPPGGPNIEGVVATPDLDQWRSSYGVSGIFLGTSEELAAQLKLDGDPLGDPFKITDWMVPIHDRLFKGCSGNIGTDIVDAEGLNGYTDIYTECEGGSSVLITVAASSGGKSVVFIEQIAPTEEDLTAAHETLASISISELGA